MAKEFVYTIKFKSKIIIKQYILIEKKSQLSLIKTKLLIWMKKNYQFLQWIMWFKLYRFIKTAIMNFFINIKIILNYIKSILKSIKLYITIC